MNVEIIIDGVKHKMVEEEENNELNCCKNCSLCEVCVTNHGICANFGDFRYLHFEKVTNKK